MKRRFRNFDPLRLVGFVAFGLVIVGFSVILSRTVWKAVSITRGSETVSSAGVVSNEDLFQFIPMTGTPDGSAEFVVKAKGESADGVWPTMMVRVNGTIAQPGVVVVDNTESKEFSFVAHNFETQSIVDVVYLNDKGSTADSDRNLIVESIAIDGVITKADQQGVLVDLGEGEEAYDGLDTQPGQMKLWWPASLRFPVEVSAEMAKVSGVKGEITVRAMGTEVLGEFSKIGVRVNGDWAEPKSMAVDSITLQDYEFVTANMTDDPQIDVVFLNDLFDPAGEGDADNVDRNVFIHGIQVDDLWIYSDDERVTTDWGDAELAYDGLNLEPGRFQMFHAGALRFDARSLPESPALKALEPLTAEPVFSEDFAAGTIDAEDWLIADRYPTPDQGMGQYKPSQLSVIDSEEATEGAKLLKIVAESAGAGNSVVSGSLKMKFSQTYGRYSFRARVDKDLERITNVAGMLLPASSNSAPRGERPGGGAIAMFKGWRDRAARSPMVLGAYWEQDEVENWDRLPLTDAAGEPISGSDWHTYELDWRPDYLAISVDGGSPQVLTTDSAQIPQWPMELSFGLEVWYGLDNPGVEPTLGESVAMYVDWVKVEAYTDPVGAS